MAIATRGVKRRSQAELGALRSSSTRRHVAVIEALCDRLSGVLARGKPQADEFARIQAALFSAGTPVRNNDAMIAAHALSSGCTLVTDDERHFAKVLGQDQENWLAQSRAG